MPAATRHFRFSGRIAPDDALHQFTLTKPGAPGPDEHYIAPTTVPVAITDPPPPQTIGVPQYSATVRGQQPTPGYDPAKSCDGSFMSYKFQANNNCYAYGCDIASNTFPQPGKQSGSLLPSTMPPFDVAGPMVQGFAEKDGLQHVGKTLADILAFQQENQTSGHFVALMISPAGDANWPGDYHWSRCDIIGTSSQPESGWSWSQKDGNDQVTNFDFAGNPILDPSVANWTVNQGPIGTTSDQPEIVVTYIFFCFMFVPFGMIPGAATYYVNII